MLRNDTPLNEERLPGDADENGKVDFADFLRLSANFGKVDSIWSDGGFDADGRVTFLDFLILSDNFGASRLKAPSQVLNSPN